MPRGPLVIASAASLAAVAWIVHLAAAPAPFSREPGLVLATGIVVFTIVDVGGLALSRGRWARNLGLGLAAGELLLAVATRLSGWSVAGALLAGVAGTGLLGPWTTGWLRMRPSAEGPGTKAMTVALGCLALVPAVPIASPSALESWHGVLAAGGIVLAWAYARAQPWSLWGVRVGLPVVAIPAVLASPAAGAVWLAVCVVAIVSVAWTREALLAIHPIADRLPNPRGGVPPGASIGGDA